MHIIPCKSLRLSYPLGSQDYDQAIKLIEILALTVSVANARGGFGQYFIDASRSLVLVLNVELEVRLERSEHSFSSPHRVSGDLHTSIARECIQSYVLSSELLKGYCEPHDRRHLPLHALSSAPSPPSYVYKPSPPRPIFLIRLRRGRRQMIRTLRTTFLSNSGTS